MTILEGKVTLPETKLVNCEYCQEEFYGGKRDVRAVYKKVNDKILTVVMCYDCVMSFSRSGDLVSVKLHTIPDHWEFSIPPATSQRKF